MDTARYSLRLSYAAFLLPFIFIYDPSLLLIGGNPVDIVLCIIRTVMSMVMLSAGFIGQLRRGVTLWGRFLLLGIGVLWIAPSVLLDLLGLAGTLFVVLDRKWIYR